MQSKIESQSINFNCTTVDYTENQTAKISELIKDLESLAATAKNLQIAIHGQADFSGTSKTNSEISQKRADKILSELLKSEKLKAFSQSIKADGVSTNEDARCKVNVKVSFTEP